jgi:hypothetical protein
MLSFSICTQVLFPTIEVFNRQIDMYWVNRCKMTRRALTASPARLSGHGTGGRLLAQIWNRFQQSLYEGR